jgi:hypothetical protein
MAVKSIDVSGYSTLTVANVVGQAKIIPRELKSLPESYNKIIEEMNAQMEKMNNPEWNKVVEDYKTAAVTSITELLSAQISLQAVNNVLQSIVDEEGSMMTSPGVFDLGKKGFSVGAKNNQGAKNTTYGSFIEDSLLGVHNLRARDMLSGSDPREDIMYDLKGRLARIELKMAGKEIHVGKITMYGAPGEAILNEVFSEERKMVALEKMAMKMKNMLLIKATELGVNGKIHLSIDTATLFVELLLKKVYDGLQSGKVIRVGATGRGKDGEMHEDRKLDPNTNTWSQVFAISIDISTAKSIASLADLYATKVVLFEAGESSRAERNAFFGLLRKVQIGKMSNEDAVNQILSTG